MSHRKAGTAATWLLWVVSCVCIVRTAHAQEVVTPAPRVYPAPGIYAVPVLGTRTEPDIVSSDALAAALETEIGAPVVDVARAQPGVPTITVAWVASGNVEVSLGSSRVPKVSRELVLTDKRPEERLEIIALVAANMVRNEAAALLPDMHPLPSAPAPAVTQKRAEVPLTDPCNVKGDAIFGIDFAPGVGNSSTRAGRAALRRLSLGFAGTLSSRLEGLEFSLGANIKTVSVCGAQITYAANIALGPVKGLQLALFNLGSDHLQGAQAGLVNVAGGAVLGVQGGVLNVAGGGVQGAQGGVVNYNGGELRGLQWGVLNVTVGELRGLQAGNANVTLGQATGLQASVANYAGGLYGAQLALANVSTGDVRGAQLGLANVSTGEVHGVQLGLFNYAEKSTASIGFLSIQRRGRTSIDTLAQVDTGTLTAAVTHGGKYVHNSYGFGVRIGKDGQRAVGTFSIGVRVLRTSLLRVDVDAISSQFYTSHMNRDTTATAGLRVPVTFMLWRGFGVIAAPSYSVMITNDERERDPSAFGNTKIHSGSTRVLGYPSLTFGLRYEFDHGA